MVPLAVRRLSLTLARETSGSGTKRIIEENSVRESLTAGVAVMKRT